MYLDVYHKALNQGFSEAEASKLADEAYEQQQYDEAQYAAEMEAEAQYWAEQEAIDEVDISAEPGR